MSTTIRKIEPSAYRRLKARAALEGKTVGEALTEAIRSYTREPAEGAPGKARPASGRTKAGKNAGAHKHPRSRPFTRPPPSRGEFVDDPFVVFEVQGHD
jgi:hypothetical protein